MVWGAFSSGAMSELVLLNGIQNYRQYIGVLEDYMLPFSDASLE